MIDLFADTKIVEILLNNRTFETVKHQLANTLIIADRDAETLLLQELYFKHVSDFREFVSKCVEGDYLALWDITNTRKKIVRNHFKAIEREQSKTDYLSRLIPKVETNKHGVAYIRDYKMNDVNKVLDVIISNQSTKQFINLVLELGEDETKAQLNMNQRQFNKKLTKTEQLCREKRIKFKGLAKSRLEQNMIKELTTLNELTKLIESEKYSDREFSKRIKQLHNLGDDVVVNAISSEKIKQPIQVLNRFGDEDIKSQCLIFINRLYKRKEVIEKRLNINASA